VRCLLTERDPLGVAGICGGGCCAAAGGCCSAPAGLMAPGRRGQAADGPACPVLERPQGGGGRNRHPGEEGRDRWRERDGSAPGLVAGESPRPDRGASDALAEPAPAARAARPSPGKREAGPVTSGSRELVELRQSAANLLQFPVLIAVVVLAMAIRQLFAHPPSTIILGACAGLAALDMVLAVYLLRNMASTLAVTADDITFTRRRRRGKGPPPSRSSSAPPAARSASAWPPMAPPAPSTPATRLSCATMPPARRCTRGRSAAVRSSRPASRKDGRSPDRPKPPCPGAATRPATSCQCRRRPIPAASRAELHEAAPGSARHPQPRSPDHHRLGLLARVPTRPAGARYGLAGTRAASSGRDGEAEARSYLAGHAEPGGAT
jgi:hypothetical protein